MKKYDESDLMRILQEFGTLLHVDFKGVLWNGVFYRVVYASLWQSVISEIKELWRSSFFPKYSKFDENARSWTEEWEKVFGFKDNCIWIGDDKFSQSLTGYLPLAVSVLRNTPKI